MKAFFNKRFTQGKAVDVFDRFYQSTDESRSIVDGYGVELSLAEEIAQMHASEYNAPGSLPAST